MPSGRSPVTANWMFINPFTFRAAASLRVWSLISATTAGGSECGGMTHAESPEWMPASSMCCITPPMTVRRPSLRQSTSTSVAFSRNWSMSTGVSRDTSAATRVMYADSSSSV